MKLQRLEFTLTTRCNSQCIHCQADAAPSKSDVMNVEDAYNYLTDTAAVSKLKSFMIFGGEPMLYPERAIAIINRAQQLRIPKIEMITNGVWGRNKAAAAKFAVRLKTVGLSSVHISVDAFHIQYIPIDYPRNAALASLKAGVENVVWNVAVIESINAANEYDTKTAQVLRKLQPIGIDAHMVKIIPVGRAAHNLRHYFQPASLHGPCEGDPLEGNTLREPESICIEPSGAACICWKLPVGNVKSVPLRRLITEYEWRKNRVTRILVEEGPTGLLRLPEAHNFRFRKEQYVSKCHLCIDIRGALKPHYPNAHSESTAIRV